MERARWSAYLEDPYLTSEEGDDPVAELDLLRRRFPYCRVLYLLQCRAMKEEGHLEWKERAREWAVLVPDRKKLFRFLTEGHDRKAEREKASSGDEEEKVLDELTQETEEDPSQELPPKGSESEKTEVIDPAPMEREIMSQAISDRILYDAEEVLGESYEIGNKNESTGREGDENVVGEAEEEKDENPEIRPFSQWLDPNVEQKAPGKGEEGKEESELIEKFIQKEEEGAVKPNEEERAEFFSSERMARKSTDESRLPVSETLAELYVQQGNIKKAVQAFEKLRLKFPEKSDYFADRIRELKDRSKR